MEHHTAAELIVPYYFVSETYEPDKLLEVLEKSYGIYGRVSFISKLNIQIIRVIRRSGLLLVSSCAC